MSLIKTTTLERNIHILQLGIQDLKNEYSSLEDQIKQLQTQIHHHQNRLDKIITTLSSKQTLLKTLEYVHQIRQEQIKTDREIIDKVLYSLQCQDFLNQFSSNIHQDLIMDEIIEYAHKLHFIHCFQQLFSPPPSHPQDEYSFHEYEMQHMIDNQYITFTTNHLDEEHGIQTLKMSIEHWFAFPEYNNKLPFSIHSHFTSLNQFIQIDER